jgi:hypothetical protein
MFEEMKTPRTYLNSGCLSIDEFVKCLKLLLRRVYELHYGTQEVMLYQKIGFAEFRWDYFAYGS